MNLTRSRLAVAALLLLCPVGADAGWRSLERGEPRRDGDALVFQDGTTSLSVSAVDDHVVRVRFHPAPAFAREHSYALVKPATTMAGVRIATTPASSTLGTASLTVTVQHDPLRIRFADAAGQVLDEDDADRGTAWSGSTSRVWKRLREDEHVYGFGEKTGEFDKRGRYRGGYVYTMWNSDTYNYNDDTDPLYVSVPFFMVMRNGRAHGFFLDNTFRSTFDVGREHPDLLSFGATRGELDYYFIDGPTPKDVVRRYTELTGRTPLPPMWSLGFHQCRYSYYPESKVRYIADSFRERRIPADTIWLDIHYQQGYAPFTWDRERFPDPKRMIGDLAAKGFHLVTIVDPHPKKEPGSAVYDSGLAGGHFVKNPDGSVFEGPVWPSNAERNPGNSVFPDFTRPATRTWWGDQFREFVDMGVAGIWNDMNEPAVFMEPQHTMPDTVRFDNDGLPSDHHEAHNVYGLLMSRGTFEGLQRLRPEKRPFVLTRATFAGGQRWAAVWPGDNASEWSHLRATVPMFLGMGLSGFSFVGSDIGGFAEFPSGELFTRWLQLGVFYPFMRVHSTIGTPDQEPWSYGTKLEAINRRTIEMRYELLPYIYTVMEESSRSGLPAFRPLMLEYPDDPKTYALGDEFLLGTDLLVAPVMREGVQERELYLPAGAWYDYATGERYEGGKRITVPVTMDRIPVFVRGGAVLFRQPVLQHTGERAGQPLRLLVHAGENAQGTVYEDAGEGYGPSSRRSVTTRSDGQAVTVDVAAPEGGWRPAARALQLELRNLKASAVSVGGKPLAAVAEKDWAAASAGWRADGNGILVKMPDSFGAVSIVAKR